MSFESEQKNENIKCLFTDEDWEYWYKQQDLERIEKIKKLKKIRQSKIDRQNYLFWIIKNRKTNANFKLFIDFNMPVRKTIEKPDLKFIPKRKIFKCDQCSKTCVDLDELRRHWWTHFRLHRKYRA